MTISSAFNFVVDLLFTVLYFQRSRRPGTPWSRQLAGFGALLLTVFLYFPGSIPALFGTIQRFALRLLLTWVYVRLTVSLPAAAGFYSVTYWTAVYMLVQSLFFAPLTYPLFDGQAVFTGTAAADVAICLLLTLHIKLPIFTAFLFLTPVDQTAPVHFRDLIPVVLVIAVTIYSRELAVPFRTAENSTALSGNYLILQAALLVLMCSLEYSRRFHRDNAVRALQRQVTDALLKNIQDQKENTQAVASLRHDIKNHLISVRLLLGEQKYGEADSYLTQLIQQAAPPRRTYSTGNALVDGLLSVKLDTPAAQGIETTVHLNLQDAGFLSNHALCTIFGNALDNCIEACSQLEPPAPRFLRISGETSAGVLLLRFENSCRQTPAVLKNGLPETIKADHSLHGYGLKNIRAVLAQHGGTLQISQDTPGRFVLTMVIPVPDAHL